jgi:hypothetical protein
MNLVVNGIKKSLFLLRGDRMLKFVHDFGVRFAVLGLRFLGCPSATKPTLGPANPALLLLIFHSNQFLVSVNVELCLLSSNVKVENV